MATLNRLYSRVDRQAVNSKVLQAFDEALRKRVESHDGTLQSRNFSSSLSSEIDDFVAEVFAAFVRLQGPTPAMIVPPIDSKGKQSHPIPLISIRGGDNQ